MCLLEFVILNILVFYFIWTLVKILIKLKTFQTMTSFRFPTLFFIFEWKNLLLSQYRRKYHYRRKSPISKIMLTCPVELWRHRPEESCDVISQYTRINAYWPITSHDFRELAAILGLPLYYFLPFRKKKFEKGEENILFLPSLKKTFLKSREKRSKT